MKAVLFDVYETLVTRTSPNIGAEERDRLMAEVAARFGYPGMTGLHEKFREAVVRAHANSPHPHPEVDNREMWLEILPGLDDADALSLAMEEAVNPVELVPSAGATLRALHEKGMRLGIVSNAQAYTRMILSRLLGADWNLFEPALFAFSYEHLRAKPDPYLFSVAMEPLLADGISPGEILMVGDSLENDILPARALGLHVEHIGPGGGFPNGWVNRMITGKPG